MNTTQTPTARGSQALVATSSLWTSMSCSMRSRMSSNQAHLSRCVVSRRRGLCTCTRSCVGACAHGLQCFTGTSGRSHTHNGVSAHGRNHGGMLDSVLLGIHLATTRMQTLPTLILQHALSHMLACRCTGSGMLCRPDGANHPLAGHQHSRSKHKHHTQAGSQRYQKECS